LNEQLLEQTWNAIDPDRLKQLLFDLVEIYSPSGKEEDVQLHIESVLQSAGVTVQRQKVDEERFNLVVTMGDAEPDLFLVGHVDTVPAWDIDDYGPSEEWGVVRGLGAADMKGGCAAMIEAWLALSSLPKAEQPSVGLLLAVGEEENGDGSSLFLKTCTPRWAVIGEPTSLVACFNHYGYVEVSLTTKGRRIHSSLPELGHNAIESMLRFLLLLDRHPLFDRRQSQLVYSIREMSSSRAGFVVPDQCDTWIDLHLPPGITTHQVKEAIQICAAEARRTIQDLDLEIEFEFSAEGYDLDLDNPLVEALESACPKLNLPLKFAPFRSHSDGNLFQQAGCNPLILGPGSLETAHTADEQTSLQEVENAARIYAALALQGIGPP